jgi:hypothetical protein
MRELDRRLRVLERARETRERSPLLVIEFGSDREPVGIQGVAGRLPEVARMPGESWAECMERAASLVRGPGPAMALALYETGAF